MTDYPDMTIFMDYAKSKNLAFDHIWEELEIKLDIPECNNQEINTSWEEISIYKYENYFNLYSRGAYIWNHPGEDVLISIIHHHLAKNGYCDFGQMTCTLCGFGEDDEYHHVQIIKFDRDVINQILEHFDGEPILDQDSYEILYQYSQNYKLDKIQVDQPLALDIPKCCNEYVDDILENIEVYNILGVFDIVNNGEEMPNCEIVIVINLVHYFLVQNGYIDFGQMTFNLIKFGSENDYVVGIQSANFGQDIILELLDTFGFQVNGPKSAAKC